MEIYQPLAINRKPGKNGLQNLNPPNHTIYKLIIPNINSFNFLLDNLEIIYYLYFVIQSTLINEEEND